MRQNLHLARAAGTASAAEHSRVVLAHEPNIPHATVLLLERLLVLPVLELLTKDGPVLAIVPLDNLRGRGGVGDKV